MPTPRVDVVTGAGVPVAASQVLPAPLFLAVAALAMMTVTLLSIAGGLMPKEAVELATDSAVTLLAEGDSAVVVGARLTARLTFVFFITAYLARPVWQRFRWTPARWALRNRRWLGLAAALSHSVHLSYVVAAQLAVNETLDVVTIVGGGLGFLLFWLMGITSNDSAVRALGKRWGWLHRGGMHYLWFIFFITYAGAATLSPWLWVFVVLLLFGALLRLANQWWPAPRDAS